MQSRPEPACASSMTIRVATIAVAALTLGSVLASTARAADDLAELRAEPPTWILDHRSGEGVRVAEEANAGQRSARSGEAGQFSSSGPAGYSPAQMRRAYDFDDVDSDGKGQIIGIPTAFDYPNAAADLAKFIKTFKLKKMYGLPGRKPCTVADGPHPCFQVVYARGTQPPFDEFWALESALDTQWAHAIAPEADILLVEASSNLFVDLFQAVQVTTNLGATVVSMSWGGLETAVISVFDPLLDVPGVTFVAASGDFGNMVNYPAASRHVIAVGGTTLRLDKKGKRKGVETAWSGSGGGISQFTAEPGYQVDHPIPPTGGFRGVPDVSYNADPATGVSVYDSHGFLGHSGWLVVNGTSAGSPQWAGLIALANELRDGDNLSGNDLTTSLLYDVAKRDYDDTFIDIRSGTNGGCGAVCTAVKGYDFVTGLGSPRAEELVEELAED